jgi:hypothetical protein
MMFHNSSTTEEILLFVSGIYVVASFILNKTERLLDQLLRIRKKIRRFKSRRSRTKRKRPQQKQRKGSHLPLRQNLPDLIVHHRAVQVRASGSDRSKCSYTRQKIGRRLSRTVVYYAYSRIGAIKNVRDRVTGIRHGIGKISRGVANRSDRCRSVQ